MLISTGVVSVEPSKGRIVLNVSNDFIGYYKWFIERRYWIRMGTPLHNAHATIYSTKHHTKVNWDNAVYYHGKEIKFEYDECIVEGGYAKGFLMYYLRVYSQEIDQMKKRLGIIESSRWKGSHVTICNGKNSSVFPDWPKMIRLNTTTQ